MASKTSALTPAASAARDEPPAAPSRPKHGPRADHVSVRERAVKAVALYKHGYTYLQIAEQLGFASRAHAWRAVNQLLASYEADEVANLRLVAGERLMDLYRVVAPAALGGDLESVDRALAIHDRYARLFGLNQQPAEAAGVMALRIEWTRDWRLGSEVEHTLTIVAPPPASDPVVVADVASTVSVASEEAR